MLRLTSVLLLLLCWHASMYSSVGSPVGTRCSRKKSTPSCVCKTPEGTIDLTKITSFDGSRRFTNVVDTKGTVYNYSPCSPFSASQPCTNVHICKFRESDNSIADYGTEEIWKHEDEYYLYYSAHSDNGTPSEAFVHLQCDPDSTNAVLTTNGDERIPNTYDFTLKSAYACPIRELPSPEPSNKCEPVLGGPSCVCRGPHGVIDLTKLGSYTRSPRFSKIKNPSQPRYNFAYNPCGAFSYPGNSACKNAQICQTYTEENTDFIIGKYGTEEIKIDMFGNITVHYSATSDDGSTRTAIVHLNCNQSIKSGSGILTTTGDEKMMLQYEFTLISCHSCPGGCK